MLNPKSLSAPFSQSRTDHPHRRRRVRNRSRTDHRRRLREARNRSTGGIWTVEMSCNGCRVLRKGCSEKCVLRTCLQWIPTPEGQGNATLFLARFFGRSDLLSLVAAVPESQRPALFQSLLFEACGRTVNPVDGAVGLLSTGNWHVCQAAVDTVLSGGALQRLPGILHSARLDDEFSTNTGVTGPSPQVDPNFSLNLNLSPNLSGKRRGKRSHFMENYWPTKTMSSLSSEESKAVTAESGGGGIKLLNLFV